MLVSILIPTISERGDQFQKMSNKLYTQIKVNQFEKKVEIISIADNRTIPLSVKRNMLQKISSGKYFLHLDDDDELTDNFLKRVVNHIESLDPKKYQDIIGYNQLAKVSGNRFIVKPNMSAGLNLQPIGNQFNPDMSIRPDVLPEYYRYPWQWNLWNERFKKVYRTDSDTNAREDVNWLRKVQLENPKSMSYIDFVGHIYNFDDPSLSSCQ
jgi:glycosyltransferase involved in cell wall biosynthesis